MDSAVAQPLLDNRRNAARRPLADVRPQLVAQPWSASGSRPLRVALYSHDTVGLGHVRRNLLIAQAVARPPLRATTLILASAREVGVLPLAPGVDCVTMPSIQKADDGEYRSRRLSLTLTQLVRMRGQIAQAALDAFSPDVFIVDTEPRGAFRELDPALSMLRGRGQTHCVLGLRDIRDRPAVTKREWQNASNDVAVREYYDQVWVYGDPAVFDVVREYGLSDEIAAKLRYTGYLDQRARLDLVRPDDYGQRILETLPRGRLMLCLLGGGQDGAHLARAFIEAPLPADAFGVVLAGPQLPADSCDDLCERAARVERMVVVRFLPEPASLLARADRLVMMGGYNTTLEALSFAKPALIVPRIRPRQEQWIRADRLSAFGLIHLLHPHELSSAALGAWLADRSRPTPAREVVDLNGLHRLMQFLGEHLNQHVEAV